MKILSVSPLEFHAIANNWHEIPINSWRIKSVGEEFEASAILTPDGINVFVDDQCIERGCIGILDAVRSVEAFFGYGQTLQ